LGGPRVRASARKFHSFRIRLSRFEPEFQFDAVPEKLITKPVDHAFIDLSALLHLTEEPFDSHSKHLCPDKAVT
jgi:hypothetical protein